jgi:hypothetical protein
MATVGSMAGKPRFRIRFLAEKVIGASTVAEALRRAKSLGATDVTSVVRER